MNLFNRFSCHLAVALMVIGIAFVPLSARAADDESEEQYSDVILEFPRVGISLIELVSFWNIPNAMRRVHVYDNPGDTRMLSKQRAGFSSSFVVGTGLVFRERVGVAVDMVRRWSYSGYSNPLIGPKTSENRFIGYDVLGWGVQISTTFKVHDVLDFKLGSMTQWVDLRSGTDAKADFQVQHSVRLPQKIFLGVGLNSHRIEAETSSGNRIGPIGGYLESGFSFSLGGSPYEFSVTLLQFTFFFQGAHYPKDICPRCAAQPALK